MLNSQAIIEKKAQFFFPNAMHFYKNPPHLVSGQGAKLFDDQGKMYHDFFAGVTVANCGHCNPAIVEPMNAQAQKLQHTSIIYLTEPMVNLAEALAKRLPGDINRSFFCCSGTEANEGALLLARMATGKKGFIAFEGGLHGRSALTMSVTGIPMWRVDPFLDPDVYFAKGFMGTDEESRQKASEAALSSVEDILKAHGDRIAALIVEPMQGNGGMHLPSDDFFEKLIHLLHAYDVLLIVDEVQTAFARTGKMFCINHFNVVPDIMTMAKALGNGQPIGVFAAREGIAKAFNKPSASTLGGNPVSMVAGLAVLDYIDQEGLIERSRLLGEKMINALKDLAKRHEGIIDVRGKGLMIGVEVQSPEWADAILETMKDKGYIIGKNGMNRNVLAFQPPLVIEEEVIYQMIDALDATLKALA